MLCLNSSHCQNGNRCLLGFCIYPKENYFTDQYSIHSNAVILPIIGATRHDLPSLWHMYIWIFIILALIGLLNNIFALMTFIRDRIRYTTFGIYLIIYCICSLLLMILILTNVLTAIYYDKYIFRLWACHGYPYLSLNMVYTSTLISAAIAIENVLIKCFNFDKFRSRKSSLFISLFIFLIVSISNLDKIFSRYLITDQSNNLYCVYDKYTYKPWSNIMFFFCIIFPCFIHLICIIRILSIKVKENFIQRIFAYQNYMVPSLFIILCVFLHGLYRYIIDFNLFNSSTFIIRLHIGFIFLLYAPQILTYMIYVLPNDFYVREFYQIWFYRKLCCCFYNKRRHVQEFEVIHRLWQRRTSLETVKTITNLDDTCVDSEFYKKT
ncbi:unnamed protein product [Adineta steineri]|uniref:G-protein coupled receptors family 1 profile domain-containing protein n=1 Tax=Adineta steineri TaxID=433720 RepID=A0A815DUA6_9BILA|nr:unnamed protein product [Adineta steineri]